MNYDSLSDIPAEHREEAQNRIMKEQPVGLREFFNDGGRKASVSMKPVKRGYKFAILDGMEREIRETGSEIKRGVPPEEEFPVDAHFGELGVSLIQIYTMTISYLEVAARSLAAGT